MTIPLNPGRPLSPEEELRARAIIAARDHGVDVASHPVPSSASDMSGADDSDVAPAEPSLTQRAVSYTAGQMLQPHPVTLDEAKAGASALGNAALPILSPGAAMLRDKMKSDELEKAKLAAAQSGTKELTDQTPGQVASAAQSQLAQQGPHVLGVAKGGFQPSTRSSQSQREHVEMPPGYNDVASEELHQKGIAGVGGVQQENELVAQARKNAAIGRNITEIERFSTEQAADDEERALKGAQDKIDSAMAEFKAGGPKMIAYKDIFDKQTGGGKVMMVLGAIAGGLGRRSSGGQNGYMKNLDNYINRQIDIQQRESERQGKAIGEAQTAYSVLHQRFRDSDVTRKALHAMYLSQFMQYVDEKAAEIGIGQGDARLASMKADLLNQQRGIMKELGSKVLEQQAETDKYVPPQAIVAPGSGGAGGAGTPTAEHYELERMKAQLPQQASAVNQLRDAASKMSDKDKSYFQDLLRRKSAVNPGSWWEYILRSEHPELTQQMLGAVNTIVQSRGGKQLTDSEAARYAASIVGDGSGDALKRGADLAQQDIDKQEETLHSAFPQEYQVGNLQRTIYRNTDQPHELEGEEKAPDKNKRVISPDSKFRKPDKEK